MFKTEYNYFHTIYTGIIGQILPPTELIDTK